MPDLDEYWLIEKNSCGFWCPASYGVHDTWAAAKAQVEKRRMNWPHTHYRVVKVTTKRQLVEEWPPQK